jgi:hypothetical protein
MLLYFFQAQTQAQTGVGAYFSPTVIAAIIGLLGVIVGAFLNATLPMLIQSFGRTAKRHSLVGEWDSSWGKLPHGPLEHHEILKITKQHGVEVSGIARRIEQPGKEWEVKGRYDGTFLQMYYYPSANAKNIDFLDYGCYFLKRRADGSFEGFSTGFGTDDYEPSQEGITTEFHMLKRRDA